MIIGHFVSNPENTRFQGQLGLFASALALIEPVEPGDEHQPDCRVSVFYRDGQSTFDVGAGWWRTSRKGKRYLSVKLDWPTFPEPIHCALVPQREEAQHALVWNRDRTDEATREATA